MCMGNWIIQNVDSYTLFGMAGRGAYGVQRRDREGYKDLEYWGIVIEG